VAQGVVIDTMFWGARAEGVAALERELARLRRVQSAHARELVRPIARASVLNLIVFADREEHARRAARSISDLALRHPSRAIVVLADRGKERERAERRIEMHCQLPIPDGARQVCYEQILVRATGDVDEARGRFGLTDLNWTRLTPWREIATAFFDVPAWRLFLDRITGLRVGFAVDMDGRDIHPSQALLLVGWLASRLGWRPLETLAPSEAGGLLFAIARPDEARIMVRVRPRFERGLDEGDIRGIRIQATDGRQQAEFVVRRVPSPRHQTATVFLDGERRWERTMPMPSPAVVELIGEELSILGSDRTYEAALGALVELA